MAEPEESESLAGTRQVLADSERGFRLMVESVRDYAIFMLDPTGHVLTWNIGAERVKGPPLYRLRLRVQHLSVLKT